MAHTFFHQIAGSEGWAHATQVDLLLRHIGAQVDLPTFADFLAQCREEGADDTIDPADHFMWEVAEHHGHPGLAFNAAVQSL